MELVKQLPAFLGAVLLIASVPVVLGLEAGLYAWILAAGAGLAALVATSHTAYTVLRVVGTAVLVVLGVQALRAARRGTYDPALPVGEQVRAARLLPRGRAGGFGIGAVTNLASPKAAVFTFAFYPQFIPHGYPVPPTAATLGLLQVTLETGLYLALAAVTGRARVWFARRRVRRTLDALCGTVLIGLGLRVATESA